MNIVDAFMVLDGTALNEWNAYSWPMPWPRS